jgi:hypothetical protein
MFKTLAGALAGLFLTIPPPAQAGDVPSGAVPRARADQNIHGRVTRFNGGFVLSVRAENGTIDRIVLHRGTIINPPGLTLAPGMVVSVTGHPAGGSFAANEIDTPYQVIDGFAYFAGQPWDGPVTDAGAGFFGGGTDGRHGLRAGGDRDGHHGGGDHGGGGGAGHGGGSAR